MSGEFLTEQIIREALLRDPAKASWSPIIGDELTSPLTVEENLTLSAEHARMYLFGEVFDLLEEGKIAVAVLADLRQNGIVYLKNDGILVKEGAKHDGRRIDRVGIGDCLWKNNRFVDVWAINHSATDPYGYKIFSIGAKGVWEI